MKKNENSVYYFAGGAIALALIAYYFITKEKDSSPLQEAPAPSPLNENGTVQTGTGSTISTQQANLPSDLTELLKKDIYEVVKVLGNRKIYTKIDDVKVRSSAKVNNGIVTNQYGIIPNKGFYVGKVTAVANDISKSVNSEGRVYKWFKVSLTPEAKKALGLLSNFNNPAYLREDTVIIK